MKIMPQVVTQKVGRELLTMRKHSPRIMFVAGIAGTIVSTVMACRATLRLPEMLDEMQSDVDGVKELKHFNKPGSNYDVKQSNKDLAYAYGINTYRIVKLYAPSVLIGAASITALTASHVTLSKRNAGLTAAYSALQLSMEKYRERVREQLGEEKERDLYSGIRTEKIQVEGKTKEIRIKDPNAISPYAKLFDEYNHNWKKNAEQNRLFIQCQQNYANHLLHARGHIFLNEVYDMLGFEHSKAGCVVGWVVGNGDNFIDFGIFETDNGDFMNGYERSVWLDFNVDGVIYDLI